jgi:threonine dehydrogenase-like Zn-dependent dehydrogenase
VDIDDPELPDEEYLFLSDIFTTGWGGLDFAGFQPGDTVAVFGAGPMGLLCAYSALLRGASRVYSVDHVEQRLQKAKTLGAVPINFAKGPEAAAQITALEPGGVARSVDCIGIECLNARLKPQPDYVIGQMAKCTAVNGGMGLPGVYVAQPDSKGTPRGSTIPAEISYPISTIWNKSISVLGGAVDQQKHQKAVFQLIKQGRARPGFIVSGVYGIEEAPVAYERFDKKLETKAIFKFPWIDDEKAVASDAEAAVSGEDDDRSGTR